MSFPQNSGSPYPPQKPSPYGDLPDPNQPPKSNRWLWIILGILLGGFVLTLVCCGVGAYYAVHNVKTIAANFARTMAVQAINESELGDEDKQEVVAQVDRVVDAYKKGEIDEKDLENILKEVQDSPLIPLAMVYGIEMQYLEKSGLTDDEKADARKQLQRFIRGGMQDKIKDDDLKALMAPLERTAPNGEKQMKDKLTDEEIRTFVAGAKKLADDAEIPDEEFKVDIGDEVKRIVDRGLKKADAPK